MRAFAGVLVLALTAPVSAAQTPQPFPSPTTTQPAKPPTPPPATQKPPAGPTSAPAATAKPAPPPVPAVDLGGIPLYPNAVYLASYDAGRGQRFHLYGVALPFAEAVAFYRSALKQKGDVLFESPPTHQFDVGRFRESDMAFPPGVTIKDYTFGGSAGYLNPKGGLPERFPTLVQIVAPAAAR